MTIAGLAEPHHDGSGLYVPRRAAVLGDETTVRLRVPHGMAAEGVVLRYVRDGEPRSVRAELDEETATDVWWRATFPVANPATRYRWFLGGGDYGYAWVNANGTHGHDVVDADDYVATTGDAGPAWHRDAVFYEIFPDRFARSGLVDEEPPDWAIPCAWDDLPVGRGPRTGRELFGGDLYGIEQHLDHVVALGATAIYLTPIFPARSNHRYNATTFDEIDPLLGGDPALTALAASAHGRGLRIITDLTINHVGDAHAWFRNAADDEGAPERSFFWFDEQRQHGYEAWLGVPTLPKLDHRSEHLRVHLYAGDEAVVQRWLRPPYELDGWRVDVANMAGRLDDIDLGHDVARAMRGASTEARADAVVVAEHAHDFRGDLQGDGWHGTMNYAGFCKPVSSWLHTDMPAGSEYLMMGLDVPWPRLGGEAVVAAMRAFRAGVPWESITHSWNLLDSHDSPRFRSCVGGSTALHAVGIGLQMTLPGVPMIFAGDEIGLEGSWGEDARRTMPWDHRDRWDGDLLEAFRRLIALRQRSVALRQGGMRHVHTSADAIAYLRETRDERVLCLAARAPHDPIRLSLAALGCTGTHTLEGDDARVFDDLLELPVTGPAFHAWKLEGPVQ